MNEDLIPERLWISRPKRHIYNKAMHRVRPGTAMPPSPYLQQNKLGHSHYPFELYYHESEVTALRDRIAELEGKT